MSIVTDSQRKVIGYIENNLGITFNGNNSFEAREFIATNIDNSKNKTNSDDIITKKQIDAVKAVCKLLNLNFKTNSKKEARKFLMNNIEKARIEVGNMIKNSQIKSNTIEILQTNENVFTTDNACYSLGMNRIEGWNEFLESMINLDDEMEHYGIESGNNSIFIPNY